MANNELLGALHSARAARRRRPCRYVGGGRDVEARVCYGGGGGGGGVGGAGQEPSDDFRTVLVRDGRAAPAPHTLDGSGFELVTGILDPPSELGPELQRATARVGAAGGGGPAGGPEGGDPAAAAAAAAAAALAALHKHVKEVVYPAVAGRLQRRLRATRVIPFDHVLRHGAPEQPAAVALHGAGPISRVHNDYSLASGFTRARMHLTDHVSSPASLERALAQRFAIVNVWAPLAAVASDPLAAVEWRSAAPRDVQRLRMTCDCERFRTRETYSRVGHNPAHRWVYFPAMQPDECLLLKTFDSSADPAVSKFALHASFALPGQERLPPRARRQSIEVRCLVFFGSAAAEDGFGEGFVPPPGQAGVPGGPRVLRREWLPRREDEWEVVAPAGAGTAAVAAAAVAGAPVHKAACGGAAPRGARGRWVVPLGWMCCLALLLAAAAAAAVLARSSVVSTSSSADEL
jgi:hypothetical protein